MTNDDRSNDMDNDYKIMLVAENIADEMEMEMQDEQWNEQNHDLTFSDTKRRNFERQADSWKQVNAARVADGTLAWDGILLEEVFEALGEIEPSKMREELVQVAAVAGSMIRYIDRTLASFDEEQLTLDFDDEDDDE